MRKFRITSEKFKGEIFLSYNADGVVNIIDTSDTSFAAKRMKGLLATLPVTLGDDIKQTLGAFAKEKALNIVEIPPDVSFDRFWNTYGKKINRKRAEGLYKKLGDADRFLAITKVKDYDRYLAWQQWRSKADPDTYIRNRMFETDFKNLKN